MRRLLVLSLVAVTLSAVPAQADHGGTTWYGHLSPRTVYFEDRTGNPSHQATIQNAVNLWNSAGANITLIYRTGPATNNCYTPTHGVVRFCIVPNNAANSWFGAMFTPDPGSGGHTTGGIVDVRADQLGPYGPLHEMGHAFGMGHSQLASVMNQSNALRTSVPTEHDYATLRSLYAHADGASTTTTTRYSICSRYPQFCR